MSAFLLALAFMFGVAFGRWWENEWELRRLKRRLRATRRSRRMTPSEAFAEVERRYCESEKRRETERLH